MIRRLTIFAFALALAATAAVAYGQTPDRRGEVAVRSFTYRGTTANAPIPPALRFRNEGGSDGLGLCVPTSITINGRYQHVPGLENGRESRLWQAAKHRPGGYGPDKLAKLVNEIMPGEKWASYVGRDTSILDKLSAEGYPIGATMNTGGLYNYMPIHHMISLAHFDSRKGVACVADNNDDAEIYRWMPATEFARRWIDGGTGWAWIWLRKPANFLLAAAIAFAVACAVGASILLIAVASAINLEPSDYQHG